MSAPALDQSTSFPPTRRTTPTRLADRARYDAETVHAILDEALICHLGFVAAGAPVVLPTVHARVGNVLYLHGSTASRPLRSAITEDGLAVCVTATLVDGVVFAKSAFHHSVNYRSVVAHGIAQLTDPDEKKAALNALVEHAAPGRAADCRAPAGKELAATAVLALPLAEVSAKVRSGPPADDEADITLPYWQGVVPLAVRAAAPEPGADVGAAPTPPYVAAYRRGAPAAPSPWYTAPTLNGRHVRLEPLTPDHIDGLFAAGADPEVWRHLSARRPHTRDDMAGLVSDMLRAVATGDRVAWAQIDQASGAVAGMTSYYEITPQHRGLGIGHTWLGRPWWRSAINTEAKLLLLERAFDELGALRVVWHTDIRNERSQAAIARLGAVREGVHRQHRIRPDGSLRDTVVFSMTADEWPAAAARLRAALNTART